MAEGFRFIPLGLVRLRTLRDVDVSLRDVTIAEMGNGATECG